jgi:hypothetical protein
MELEKDLPYKAKFLDKFGYHYVCDGEIHRHHIPMDNLDYIEHLAKQRGLGV